MSYKKSVGRRGEAIAAEYLEGLGYTVTAKNFLIGHDEIDIICEDQKYIVFTEVKSRCQTLTNKLYGRPAAAVDPQKQHKLLRAAAKYLRRFPTPKQPRIDVVEVFFPPIRESTPIDTEKLIATDIKHIKNAVHR